MYLHASIFEIILFSSNCFIFHQRVNDSSLLEAEYLRLEILEFVEYIEFGVLIEEKWQLCY